MKASVYTGWCEWVSEVKRSMTNEGWRVCVWYQCQGVCFCAWPAVSLNNPTCLGPTVIHSLSGNLQYGGEIKRSPRQDWWGVVMKHYEQADRAHRGRRIPLISPPPLSWRVVYREGEWGKSCADRLDPDSDMSAGPGLLLCGTGLRAPVGQMCDLLHDDLNNPLQPKQYKYNPIYRLLQNYNWGETPLTGTISNRFTPNVHLYTCKWVVRQNLQPSQEGYKRALCLGLDNLQRKQTPTIPLHCGEHDAEHRRTQMLPATLRWSRDQTAVCSFMKLIHETKLERKDRVRKHDADPTLWKENSAGKTASLSVFFGHFFRLSVQSELFTFK